MYIAALHVEGKQQFLALSVHCHDVYVGDKRMEVGDGFVPVEHRRELYHHEACLATEVRKQLHHVRRAVRNGKGSCSVGITACRVDEYKGLRVDGLKLLHGIAAHHRGVVGTEHLEVMLNYLAQFGVALSVLRTAEVARNEIEINAETARKVRHGSPTAFVRGIFLALKRIQ